MLAHMIVSMIKNIKKVLQMYSQDNSWFVHQTNKADIKLRLFCFHHSGGTASFFREWSQFLPPEVELIAVQLPGREARNSHTFITDVSIIAKQITDNFHRYQTIPFVFFGHSLGSLIAFEVAHELRRYYLKSPKYLIVSGRNAPHTQSRDEILHNLPDEQLVKGLMKYQGLPDEILQNKELLEVLLPRLRADFTLSETYQYKKRPTLDCPILALGGDNDPTVNYDELAAWETQTIKKCSVKLFPGGHFFLSTAKKEVWDVISLALKEALDPDQKTI
jgi:medium-chain acyl-[acyl-carrier-protein] hydrolase